MVDAVVSFGLEKLWDLLSQEYEQVYGVESQVNELKCKLGLLSSLMKDADAKKHTDNTVKTFVEQVKEIVYDGEDTVETFILKDKLRKRSGIENHITRLACFIPDDRKYALDIRGILTRISSVIQDMRSYGIKITDDGNTQPQRDRIRELHQTFPTDYESDFVGLEANVKKLVKYFVEGDNVQVVTITGMGGLGKTTLARQVFNHEDVRKQFNGFSWVCVSQDCKTENVWQKILVDLKSREEEQKILKMSVSTLQAELFQLLETSKSLIVIDDVWKEEDWNQIKLILPPKKSWKLLLTSRNESVAVHNTYRNFKPECLTFEESWKLLQTIVFSRNDVSGCEINEEMDKMGKEMVKHCGGLPLAIKVLGGLLAGNYTRYDWERLSENIRSHIFRGKDRFNDNITNSIDHVLSLSFEELPSYLKHCFLYMAHFPEDHIIDIEKLSYYWAAEGVFQRRHYDGGIIRDVGDSYIKELVKRNMIISKRDDTTLRFETCHLHDMMREICLSKAKEENFLQITSQHPLTVDSQSPYKSRRVVYQYPTALSIGRDIENPKLRSLVVFQVNYLWAEGCKLTISSFRRLELLRVLDIFKSNFGGRKLPSRIGKLIHLRYLSFKRAEGVSHLPSSLGNLILLIYLDIDVVSTGENGVFVPNVLTEMKDLRYLALPYTMHGSKKLELSSLVNLEELKNFSTKHCSLNDLHGMAKLRSLLIHLCPEISLKTVHASISGLRHLENLEIDGGEDTLKEELVWDFVNLKRLMLRTAIRLKLPKAEHFPSQLTNLHLYYYTAEDPMPILEKLPKLKKVALTSFSFVGLRIVCSSGGFPQLQKLSFLLLWGLEDWTVEEGSMPFLHTLSIFDCPKLEKLPDGLRFITSLKELEIKIFDLDMKKEWKERLSEGGEDYYKVQHIPSIKFF